MKIIIAIPIYRNKFQNPILFFSQTNFTVGSIILIPYSKSIKTKKLAEKPALVIEISSLKENKQFLRKNDVEIDKIINPYSLKLISSINIEDIKLKSTKIKKPLEFSLEKLFSKKILNEINKLTETSNKSDILKYTEKINSNFIIKKLKPFLKKKEKPSIKKRGAQNISSFLSESKTTKNKLHTEKHYLVDEIRKYFNETSSKGKGSFGFYLGFFKRIPEATIYLYWSEVKESRKSIKSQQKIFWWKIGQLLKKK